MSGSCFDSLFGGPGGRELFWPWHNVGEKKVLRVVEGRLPKVPRLGWAGGVGGMRLSMYLT